MERCSVMPLLRGKLLNSTSKFGLAKARMIFVPIVAGAALAVGGVSLNAGTANAAAVVCAPDASGTAIGTANGAATDESCAGPGDIINYSTAATQNGNVLLDSSDVAPVVISGGAGNGIQVNAAGHDVGIADVVLTAPGVASITGGTNGIVMTGTGGNLSVNLSANANGVPVTGLAGAGMNLSTTGAGSIAVTTNGDVSGTTSGITTSADSGRTTVTQLRGTITGANGLVVTAGTGAVTIDTSAGATIANAGTGIRGTITGPANTSAVTITAGNVTATGTGVLAQAAGSGSATINSAEFVTVDNTAGLTYGLVANALGTGDATISIGGPVFVNGLSGSAALSASTTTGIATITLNGAATASEGSGLVVASTTGDVFINNANAIKGAGTTADPVVRFTSTGGAINGTLQLNNNTGGVIQSNGNLSGDLAIAATTAGTGFVQINNSGRIVGRVDFSGASSAQFNNLSNESWHVSGTSTFTAGNDMLNNGNAGGNVTGLIATSGVTTLDFLGGVDEINNFDPSTIVVGEVTGASELNIAHTGTVTINNSGTIMLGSLDGGLTTDGETDDYLNVPTAAFVSSGNSRLMVDANLGVNSSNACVGNPYADCLNIGASSGTGTRVSVNNTNALPGALNLTGITVVTATSGSANDFTLSNADANVVDTPQGLAIPTGFIQYQMMFDSANTQWDLVGVPNSSLVELLPLMDGLQTLWYATADGWNERTAAIRHDYAAGHYASNTDTGWSLWGKSYYGQYDSDGSQTLANVAYGNTLAYSNDYRQAFAGVQAGADYTVRDDRKGAWVFGGLAGFNKSDLGYDADTNSLDFTVWNLGLYGSYVSPGPFFADVLVKDDIATIDTLFAHNPTPTIDANSLGVSGTIGARFIGAGNVSLEPMLNLGYVHTEVDDIDDQTNIIGLAPDDSLRGRASVRLSTDLQDDGTIIQPFVVAGIGHEFWGENSLSISSGSGVGQNLTFTDRPLRTYGLGSIGVNIFSDGPLSGFGKVDGLVASQAEGFALRAGLRYAIGQTHVPPK